VARALGALTPLYFLSGCGPGAEDIAARRADDAGYVSAMSTVLTRGMAPEFDAGGQALADSVRRGTIEMSTALIALRARRDAYVTAHPENASRMRAEDEIVRRIWVKCRRVGHTRASSRCFQRERDASRRDSAWWSSGDR
jgi:hypothetical protein